MALDIYFSEDIANVIESGAFVALMTASAHGVVNAEFARGFLCQTQATCMAFGIEWQTILDHLRQQAQIAGLTVLLDAVNVPVLGK